MDPVRKQTLASLVPFLGAAEAKRSCLPVSLYMLVEAAGYWPNGSPTLAEFVQVMTRGGLLANRDWSRPGVSRILRDYYDVHLVSWQLAGVQPSNLGRMLQAGYINSAEEQKFFEEEVDGRSVEQLVRQGYPVCVTMAPGFGTPHNKNIHALIVLDWTDKAVTVIDPDERNLKASFEPEYVRSMLSPLGAGTVVLPAHLVK